MIIPWQQLDSETLKNIMESFVLREGTDYGVEELSLAEKVADIERQLKSGEVVILWSELHETVTLCAAKEIR